MTEVDPADVQPESAAPAPESQDKPGDQAPDQPLAEGQADAAQAGEKAEPEKKKKPKRTFAQ